MHTSEEWPKNMEQKAKKPKDLNQLQTLGEHLTQLPAEPPHTVHTVHCTPLNIIHMAQHRWKHCPISYQDINTVFFAIFIFAWGSDDLEQLIKAAAFMH